MKNDYVNFIFLNIVILPFLLPELEGLQYEERLWEINLPEMVQRRERGGLIQIYKLWNKMEETDNENLMLSLVGNTRHTRGHSKKLRKGRCLINIKKYSFPQRNIEEEGRKRKK